MQVLSGLDGVDLSILLTYLERMDDDLILEEFDNLESQLIAWLDGVRTPTGKDLSYRDRYLLVTELWEHTPSERFEWYVQLLGHIRPPKFFLKDLL